MMNIVVLEALTFGLNRLSTAADKFGYKLILLTKDRSMYNYELSLPQSSNIKIIDIDTFNIDAICDVIDTIGNVAGIISTTDTWSIPYLEIASSSGLSSQKPEVIKLIRDKYRLRECLYHAKLSSEKSIEVSPNDFDWKDLHLKLSYPCIIKDSAGTGSQYVWIAYNNFEALNIINSAKKTTLRGKLTIEPFFSGVLYSIETISWNGETKVLALTSRIISEEPFFREEAFSLPIILSSDEEKKVFTWINNVLECVGYDRGFAHTEFIKTKNGFEVVEINPRLGGVQIGESICQIYEYNIYEAWIEMALNRRPKLMDIPLNAVKGISQIIVYAKQQGVFSHVKGLDRLLDHPGALIFYPTAINKKRIDYLDDQRASIGILFAEGSNSEDALYNAFAAQNKIRVVMFPEHDSNAGPLEEPSKTTSN